MALRLFALAISLLFLLNGCKKEIVESTLQYAALDPLNPDEDAGTWKPILLSAPNEIEVPTPDSLKSAAYIAELNEIKSWQQELTSEEKSLVSYWSAGAVLRWNEITRELVARHNIPPQENPDGSYPVPSAGNPFAYPSFPFSNPPYAARAYAYVSAAQYDALVAAYYYKKLYQRAAPYRQDAGIEALVPESPLGSYPSEDAVVIGATVEILKLLFPADQDYLQQKAEEHRRARMIAGANVRSELNAGEALGKAIAQKFTARARTDKAGSSGGNAAYWEALKANAQNKGLTAWESMELPARPPMLPLFGQVKAFLFDSATLVSSLRPEAPPLPGTMAFNQELEEVAAFSKNLQRDKLAIVHFWADGINTYTPPGHWNAIAAAEFVAQRYSEVRWARNLALLNMSMMDAAIACWDTKYFYFTARPSQIDQNIKTWTGLPNFPTYTSGHSTFSGAAATVLSHVIPSKAGTFAAMADEASISRLYGAIHFRSDCEEGLTCGQRIGQLAVQRAVTDGAE